MADEQDLDRNEAATPYKLLKAQEKGQVAKSAETISALVWTVAAVYLTWKGWDSVREQFIFDQSLLLRMAGLDADGGALWPLASRMAVAAMAQLLPFFATIMLAAVLANLVQTGPMFTTDPIKADFDRLNPVNGFKKVFSMRTLFDAARACVKLVLLAGVSYYALKSLAPHFFGVASLSPLAYLRTLLQDAASLSMKMALILALIAAVDWMYTRREFSKKMKMSRRELKDESKNREGDPRIRARLRELRREALKRTLTVRNTKNADVLLTNPTHVAVALRYRHGEMSSPQMVAKGAGQVAGVMRKIASENNIPIVQNPALARRLFRELAVEQHVPQSMYAEVARIIVWVFAMRERRQGMAAA